MLALAADTADLPQELARHEDRLARLAEAKAMMEARARERFASEQAEHEAKLKARAEKQRATGKKSDGKPPAPPTAGLGARDQTT